MNEDEARGAVDRLLASGVPDAEIRVLMGSAEHDARDEPVGSFAGEGDAEVGTFAGAPGSNHDAMGTFAGPGDQRRGGFGDIDREQVTTYADGIRKVRVASHRRLQRLLVGAGLDEATAAADVEALHHGRILVLVRSARPAEELAALLDATAPA
jgi:hypothetical protein